MPAPSLTAAQIGERLEQARAVETEAAEQLRLVRVAAVAADTDESPEETKAAAALAKAQADVERLRAAYEAALEAERLQARRLAQADRDAQDRMTVKLVEQFEAAGVAMDKALEGYVRAWLKLVETGREVQTELRNRRGVVRADLNVPPLTPVVESRLHALAPFQATSHGGTASVPGARSNGLVRDPTRIPPVAAAISSLASAVKADIEAARARQPALEPAEGW